MYTYITYINIYIYVNELKDNNIKRKEEKKKILLHTDAAAH